MYKTKKLFACLLLAFVLIILPFQVFASEPNTSSIGSEELPFESYTYWTEYGAKDKTAVYCKPMYKVEKILDAKAFKETEIMSVNDICSDEYGDVYILDSAASKIYVTDKKYQHKYTVEKITLSDEAISVDGAMGIFVHKDKIYIADTKNARVLILDKSGKVEKLLLLPDSRLIPENFLYRPIRVVVDSQGYTYIASDGSFYGALVYSPQMEFLGFYGANTVKVEPLDAIKNLFERIFSNDVKRGASVLALPYQFNDMTVGPNDFIYTSTGATGEMTQTGQICIMNPGGKNILDEDGYNFADAKIGAYHGKWLYQDISGIDVDENGFFYVLDSTYGRVFWYDNECNLFSVFGGNVGTGAQKGTFSLANSIAINGTDVLVSDGLKKSVTVFSITDYGSAVRSAQIKIQNDDFSTAINDWENVLKEDQNSQFAYRGLGKAYFEAGDFAKSQKYAKLGADRDTYSDAFEKIRSEFLSKYFGLIFFGVMVVFVGIIVLLAYKKKNNIVLFKNEKLKIALDCVAHPFESFRMVKEKQQGSMFIATIILALFYMVSAVEDTANGFAFNFFDASTYNSIFVLLKTVGFIGIWTASNWLVCVLLGGIAKIKEIYIVTCYSLIPIICASFISILSTHILVPDEYAFITVLKVVCTLYTLFVLIIGIMRVQDFEFKKFFWTAVLSVISMFIIVFLISLIFLISQQIFGWIGTIFVELKYR